MDRIIFALAAGALEPGDALAVRRRAVDPAWRARLDAARARLDAEPAAGPWLLGGAGRIGLGPLHLDAGPWKAGDRLPVVLGAELPPDARLAVTVHTRRGRRVLSPVEGRYIRIAQLRRTEDGYALDLVLDAVEGLHRVVVRVLAPADDAELASAEVVVRVA